MSELICNKPKPISYYIIGSSKIKGLISGVDAQSESGIRSPCERSECD